MTEAVTFASRRLYWRYLRALFYDEMTQSGGRVRLCADDVCGLVAGLVAIGLARTDPHGMGLAVMAALQVARSDGGVAPGLWALGPIVRGVFWECTAVPDIRVQAQTVAGAVAEHLAVTG